jgi:hypothetical protein
LSPIPAAAGYRSIVGDDEVEREERAIYLIVIAALAPVVVVAVVRNVDFGGGTTLCLTGVVLGAIGLMASVVRALRRPRLPRARVRVSRSRSAP